MERTRTEPTERATLTVEEAGKLLGLGRQLSYAAAERGEIPVLRFGRRLVVPRARLMALLGENGDRLADVRARVARLNDALEDGDLVLSREIGRDLEADLNATETE